VSRATMNESRLARSHHMSVRDRQMLAAAYAPAIAFAAVLIAARFSRTRRRQLRAAT
jgi:predicted MFS family arabinose efflux permease